MPHIDFSPTGTSLGWQFSLEGQPPENVAASAGGYQHLHWGIAVGRMYNDARLATGKRLSEMSGGVSIKIGHANAEGQEKSRQGAPIWGVLWYFEARAADVEIPGDSERYHLQLYVSAAIFERLRALVMAGRLPTIEAEVGSDRMFNNQQQPDDIDAIKYGPVVNAPREWDNKRFPQVTVKWTTFSVRSELKSDQTSSRRVELYASEEPNDGMASLTRSDLREFGNRASAIEQRFDQFIRRLIIPIWVCVALLAWLALRGR